MAKFDVDLTKHVYEIRWKALKQSISSVNYIPEQELGEKMATLKLVYQVMEELERFISDRMMDHASHELTAAMEKIIKENVE